MRIVGAVALTLAALVLVGCHQAPSLFARSGAPAPGTPPLEDIGTINDLQQRFIDDVGKTRLVLLVSPT
jgi:hypothetical protein